MLKAHLSLFRSLPSIKGRKLQQNNSTGIFQFLRLVHELNFGSFMNLIDELKCFCHHEIERNIAPVAK
jgi:hypothetical protein